MNIFSRIGKPKGIVGIEFGQEHVGFAVRKTNGSLHNVAALRPDSDHPSDDDWIALVQQFVTKHSLQKYQCNIVLPASDYQIMLVERPDVPDNELRDAIKWGVKDLINASLDSVVIDLFNLPRDAKNAGKKEMIYVVIADLARVKHFIDLTRDVGLELKNIDIEVLSLRNLTLVKDIQRGSAVVRLRPGAGDVSIYRDGNLYLSRHFKLDFSGGLLDDLPEDALALEIQRSFDYVERQMGQSPPGVLFLCGEGLGPEKITETLQRSLPCKAEFLDLSSELDLTEQDVDPGILQICVAAIGSVFRKEAA